MVSLSNHEKAHGADSPPFDELRANGGGVWSVMFTNLTKTQALLPASRGAMAMLATCVTNAAVVNDPFAASAATRIARNSSSPM